jgi:general stress protein 26
MTSPHHTKLDERFSDPGTRASDWERTAEILAAAELFWLTSMRADGRPHVTPLVAVWVEDQLYFCTGPEEQKARNLRLDPRVALTTGCNTWEEGLDVVLEGEAVRVTDQATLRRLAEAWRTKWDGRWRFDVGRDCFLHPGSDSQALVFGVAPTRVLAFGKGQFTQTSYRF